MNKKGHATSPSFDRMTDQNIMIKVYKIINLNISYNFTETDFKKYKPSELMND